MKVQDMINSIDRKDWERAFNTDNSRLEGMFKLIKDPRKLVGRSAAVYLVSINEVRDIDWFAERTSLRNLEGAAGDDRYGMRDEFKNYDILSNPELKKLVNFAEITEKVMKHRAIEEAKRIKEEEEAAKLRSAKRVESAIEELLRLIDGDSTVVMYSRPTWHTWQGRIGQYSHSWYRASGTQIKKRETVLDTLRKYDEGGYFVKLYIPEGYAMGMHYNSITKYYTNVYDVATNNTQYDSDCDVTILKAPKIKQNIAKDLRDKLSQFNEELTEDEITRALNFFI